MNFDKAVSDWENNDGWQFAGRAAERHFFYEAGRASAENQPARAHEARLADLESALQFADYLMTSAARLLGLLAAEDTEDDRLMKPAHFAAWEDRVDCSTKVERNIYEYRKRRRLTDRTDYRAPKTRES